MKNQIKRVEIAGLFNYLDFDVTLTDYPITIIHGVNGCGKTEFIRVLRDMINTIPFNHSRWIPFVKKCKITLDNGKTAEYLQTDKTQIIATINPDYLRCFALPILGHNDEYDLLLEIKETLHWPYEPETNTNTQRIGLFVSIINDASAYIQLRQINYRGKYEFVSTITGNPIAWDQMSIGHRRLIHLYYQLIFRTYKSNVVLIDTPETDLHVTAQGEFLKNLVKIQELHPFQAIIATHSPQIINNKLDYLVSIRPYNKD